MKRLGLVLSITLAFALPAAPLEARKPRHKKEEQPAPAPQAEEADAAGQPGTAAIAWWPPSAIVGPAKVRLAGGATFDMPADYVFFGKEDSQKLMEKLGNKPGANDVGTIIPKAIGQKKFFVTVDWDPVGYIKDDDADKLDAAQILESIREGNEEANKFRAEHGFKPVTVVGWGEPPRYEREVHHMVWAIIGRSEGGESVNFNTRLLGREGYLSLNLVCSPDQLAGLKPTMKDLLSRTTYDAGKRYADFQPGKDKVAEFGLAALVVGGAALAGKAAKVGLLAKFGKLLLALVLALKKAFILVIIALAALLKGLFGKKARPADAPAPAQPDQPPRE
jgi:uncharacterized membrane-anchored protein